MLQQVPYTQYAGQAIDTLSKRAFLITRQGDESNVMTIAWGAIGFMWGKPVFQIMVRPSRHSYALLEASGEFTVSIPKEGDLADALTLCGSASGRDTDKFTAAGLTPLPAQQIHTPAIAECQLHYECRVLYKHTMPPHQLEAELEAKWYGGGNHHILYYGEILACYETQCDK